MIQTKAIILNSIEILGNKEIALALLQSENHYFFNIELEHNNEQIVMKINYDDTKFKEWEVLFKLEKSEKLRSLLNIGKMYLNLEKTQYTYYLHPNQLLFDINLQVKLIHKGILDKIIPYEKLTQAQFILIYKAMILSLLEQKKTFDELIHGQLPFYNKTKFSKILNSKTEVYEIITLLQQQYEQEIEKQKRYTKITKKRFRSLKLLIIFLILLFLIFTTITSWYYFSLLPYYKKTNSLYLAYIQKKYKESQKIAMTINEKDLDNNLKYILVVSIIMNEEISGEQKNKFIQFISKYDANYQKFWLLFGSKQYEKALDIASYLNNDELLLYCLNKKINEIKQNPNLNTDLRNKQITEYTKRIEQLKQKKAK